MISLQMMFLWTKGLHLRRRSLRYGRDDTLDATRFRITFEKTSATEEILRLRLRLRSGWQVGAMVFRIWFEVLRLRSLRTACSGWHFIMTRFLDSGFACARNDTLNATGFRITFEVTSATEYILRRGRLRPCSGWQVKAMDYWTWQRDSSATSMVEQSPWNGLCSSFRLTRSGRFCLRQMTHWVTASFTPQLSRPKAVHSLWPWQFVCPCCHIPSCASVIMLSGPFVLHFCLYICYLCNNIVNACVFCILIIDKR